MLKKLLILWFTVLPIFAFAQLPPIKTQNGIEFIEGGVGSEEVDAMRAEARSWPLEIVFSKSVSEAAQWVSDVSLLIKDAKGVEVFSHQVDGPIIFLKLKPGKYSSQSTYEGQSITKDFVIQSNGHQKVIVRWK